VSGGVPVLGEDDVLEALAEAVDDGDDGVPVFHRERAAYSINGWAEVVLDVDDEEGVGGMEGEHACLMIGERFELRWKPTFAMMVRREDKAPG